MIFEPDLSKLSLAVQGNCDINSGSYTERLTVEFIVPGETPDLSKLFLSLKDPLNSTTVESVSKFDFCNNIFLVIQVPKWNNRLWT